MNNAHVNQLMHTLKFEYVSIPFSLCNIKLKRNLNELSDFVKAFNPQSESLFKNAPLLIQQIQYVSLKNDIFSAITDVCSTVQVKYLLLHTF